MFVKIFLNYFFCIFAKISMNTIEYPRILKKIHNGHHASNEKTHGEYLFIEADKG